MPPTKNKTKQNKGKIPLMQEKHSLAKYFDSFQEVANVGGGLLPLDNYFDRLKLNEDKDGSLYLKTVVERECRNQKQMRKDKKEGGGDTKKGGWSGYNMRSSGGVDTR